MGMKLRILRHGLTASNREHRYLGWTDEPLCEEGIRNLSALPVDDTVDLVVTSGLARTRMTASILYPKAEILSRSGLNEMHFGRFEGKNWEELAEDSDYRRWVEGGCIERCPEGEGLQDLQHRVDRTMRELQILLAGRSSLAMVVHGGTIMAMVSLYAHPPVGFFDGMVRPGEGYQAEWSWEGDRMFLRELRPAKGARE